MSMESEFTKARLMQTERGRRLLGTSASNAAPWETWDEAMDPLRGCPDHLKLAVEDYQRRRHEKTSSQNLEELVRQQEKSREMVKEFRFYKQDELLDEKSRRGQVMDCFEFLEKLNTIRPAYLSAVVRRGLSGLAIYKPHAGIDGLRQDWMYVCGVQVGYMYEYSVIRVDNHGLPTNEKYRGWRTVLLRAIQKDCLTEEEVDRVFGPATGPASRRYREQLFCWRHRAEKEKDESTHV
jgi:hypothetical protein